MLDAESRRSLQGEISERIAEDRRILDSLRSEIRPLRGCVRRIQPRSTTAISLVGTDGGNMTLQFDPFLVQVVRVVDSSNNAYCVQAVTPTTSVARLSTQQFDTHGQPRTLLGEMMASLGVRDLDELSPLIHT